MWFSFFKICWPFTYSSLPLDPHILFIFAISHKYDLSALAHSGNELESKKEKPKDLTMGIPPK
jgi:hypothetical protein